MKRLAAVTHARDALSLTEAHIPDMTRDEARRRIRRLRAALSQLLEYVEDEPRTVRLAAQHDDEFRNLARAARMEIHAARNSLARLDAFEAALTAVVWPPESEGGEPS